MTILDSIAYDLRHTMPISVLIEDFLDVSHVCLSLPAVVGRSGVTRVLHPSLSGEEQDSFRHCAKVVRKTINQIGC
jgi:L-lactate dehydrogenase